MKLNERNLGISEENIKGIGRENVSSNTFFIKSSLE